MADSGSAQLGQPCRPYWADLIGQKVADLAPLAAPLGGALGVPPWPPSGAVYLNTPSQLQGEVQDLER